MDKQRAVRLLKKWIVFNGMDDPEGWEVEAGEKPLWPKVQKTVTAIKYVIFRLEEKEVPVQYKISQDEAFELITDWIAFNGMGNSEVWAEEDFPFVRNCKRAIEYSVEVLKK